MNFINTNILGAYIIKPDPYVDKRGEFSRIFCERVFDQNGLVNHFPQINICKNNLKGTLRGMHYQKKEFSEDKVVSCICGKIYDVIVDLRSDSETFLQSYGIELSEKNGFQLYIPKGCAHGYVTLEDNSNLLYLMSEFYNKDSSAGYRYDDPAFSIKWPVFENYIISEKDKNLPYIKI